MWGKKRAKQCLIVLAVLSLLVAVMPKQDSQAMSISEALELYKTDIIKSSRKTGVWASLTAAQFILEAGNPVSKLAEVDNNYFGIKWGEDYAEKYPGAYPVTYSTLEDIGGTFERIDAPFTHFPTVQDCITEHSIIWWNGYYQPELDILYDLDSSRDAFLLEVGNGPYATDNGYDYKLRRIIAMYNLDELDKVAFPEGRRYCGYNGEAVGVYDYPDDGYNDDELIQSATYYEQQGIKKLKIEDYDLIGLPEQSKLIDVNEGIELSELKSVDTGENPMIKSLREAIEKSGTWTFADFLQMAFISLGSILLAYSIMLLVLFICSKWCNTDLVRMASLHLVTANAPITFILVEVLFMALGSCLLLVYYLVK